MVKKKILFLFMSLSLAVFPRQYVFADDQGEMKGLSEVELQARKKILEQDIRIGQELASQDFDLKIKEIEKKLRDTKDEKKRKGFKSQLLALKEEKKSFTAYDEKLLREVRDQLEKSGIPQPEPLGKSQRTSVEDLEKLRTRERVLDEKGRSLVGEVRALDQQIQSLKTAQSLDGLSDLEEQRQQKAKNLSKVVAEWNQAKKDLMQHMDDGSAGQKLSQKQLVKGESKPHVSRTLSSLPSVPEDKPVVPEIESFVRKSAASPHVPRPPKDDKKRGH